MFDHYRSMPVECEFKGCQEIAVGEDSWCAWCLKTQCRRHYDRQSHGCRYTNLERYPNKSLMDCLRGLDRDAIKAKAEALRPGHTCEVKIPLDGTALAGAYNVHVSITFDDGEEWLMRTPYQNGPSPRIELHERIYESEVTTLRTLLDLGVPVPSVYDHGVATLSKDKSKPVVYTFFEKVAGRPLDNEARWTFKRLSIDSYARHLITISNAKFNFVGSLDGTGSRDNVVNTRVGLSPVAPHFGGPFKSLKELYLHNLENVIGAIMDGTMYRDRPMFEYLAHLDVKQWLLDDKSMDLDEGEGFYLWHPDSHSDNMMIGEDQSISSMIDWQGATTMPKAVAFCGPEWMWGAGPLWDPTNKLSEDEKYLCEVLIEHQRDDLAECVAEGRLHQRLNCFIGGGLGYAVSRLHQLRCIEPLFTQATPDHADEDEEAWLYRAMSRHSLDPHYGHVARLESLKISGRQPQLPYQYISNTALLMLLEGMSVIRHGVRHAWYAIRFLGGRGVALA